MGIRQLYNDNLRKLPNKFGDVSVMNYDTDSGCSQYGQINNNQLSTLHNSIVQLTWTQTYQCNIETFPCENDLANPALI